MVNKKLLEKDFEFYRTKNIEMKPVKYNKDIFPRLFDKFKTYGMTEDLYCCHGIDRCCWQELIEEGVWSLTYDDVKRNIIRNVKGAKKYLYNQRKYGKDRLYMFENDEICYVYIYTRDLMGVDYSMWFSIDEQ